MDDEEREGGRGTGIAAAAGWTARQDKGILRPVISELTFLLGNQFITKLRLTFPFSFEIESSERQSTMQTKSFVGSGHSLR